MYSPILTYEQVYRQQQRYYITPLVYSRPAPPKIGPSFFRIASEQTYESQSLGVRDTLARRPLNR